MFRCCFRGKQERDYCELERTISAMYANMEAVVQASAMLAEDGSVTRYRRAYLWPSAGLSSPPSSGEDHPQEAGGRPRPRPISTTLTHSARGLNIPSAGSAVNSPEGTRSWTGTSPTGEQDPQRQLEGAESRPGPWSTSSSVQSPSWQRQLQQHKEQQAATAFVAWSSLRSGGRRREPSLLGCAREEGQEDQGGGHGREQGEAGPCAVCMTEMVNGEWVQVLPCGHLFHQGCVGPWLRKSTTCPMCRKEIDPHDADSGLDPDAESFHTTDVWRSSSL